jgi:hypothetical protein
MKKILIFLSLTVLIILYFSCQDPYPLNNLDSSKKIPVIEGMIKNDTGPHQISLYYALPYNDDARQRIAISGANVYVTDDLNNTFNFKEKSSGAYVSDPKTFRGIIGRTYTLHVEMPDGYILRSDPELLRDTLRVDRIFKRTENREDYYRDSENKIITYNTEGQSNYAIFDASYQDKAYYRLVSYYLYYNETVFDTAFFRHIIAGGYDYEFEIDSAVYSKCTETTYDSRLPVVGIYNPGHASENIELSFFIPKDKYYMRDDNGDEGSRSLYTFIYTISPLAYNYYKEINDQLNASPRIFDPLPTQLMGNMHCVNDSSLVVLGLFEASSFTLNKTHEYLHKMGCYDSTAISIYPFGSTKIN